MIESSLGIFLKISNLGHSPWRERIFKTLHVLAYGAFVYGIVNIPMDSSPPDCPIPAAEQRKANPKQTYSER